MRLSIKNYKHSKHLSQETDAFSCTLYWDGKKVADASNDGQGGSHRYWWYAVSARDEITQYAKEWDIATNGEAFESLDALVDHLRVQQVEEKAHKSMAKKMAKKGCPVTLLVETPQEFRYFGVRPSMLDNKEAYAKVVFDAGGTSYRVLHP